MYLKTISEIFLHSMSIYELGDQFHRIEFQYPVLYTALQTAVALHYDMLQCIAVSSSRNDPPSPLTFLYLHTPNICRVIFSLMFDEAVNNFLRMLISKYVSCKQDHSITYVQELVDYLY